MDRGQTDNMIYIAKKKTNKKISFKGLSIRALVLLNATEFSLLL